MDQLLQESIREWTQKVLLPFLREEVQGQVADYINLAIISADTDKIKDYVFESPKLPEIRGASIRLDELNQGDPLPDYQQGDPRRPQNIREILKYWGLPTESIDNSPPGCIAFAGGGSLMALVPFELNGIKVAEMLCVDIMALYPEKTGKATITCVMESWKIGMTPRDAIKNAISALQRAKEEKALLPFFESHPFVRRCDSCHWRPAVLFKPDPDGIEVARCRVCFEKFCIGKEEKSRWHQEFNRQYKVSSEMATDLSDISKFSNGYIGFVYADGNRLGDWVNNVDSFEKYGQRSRAVSKSIGKAVYEAIHRHLGPNFDRKFEVITIGGDDAIIIVPASWALAIAHDICREFYTQMRKRVQQDLTMSAGVVIADAHTPVYFLRRIAEVLLKNAKSEVKNDKNEGTIDFLVLKSQTMLATDLAHLRGTEPWSIIDPVERARLHLSHGPYTLSELNQLLELVYQGQKVGFSRSQLHTLNQALEKGRSASNLLFLYQQARAREATQKFMLAFQERFCPRPNEDMPPWQKMADRRGRHEYRTAWADMVEIWDFAQGVEENNAHTN